MENEEQNLAEWYAWLEEEYEPFFQEHNKRVIEEMKAELEAVS